MRQRRDGWSWAGVAASATMCVLLAGCGDQSTTDDPDPQAPAQGDLTPMGSSLAVGETATVPVEGGDGVIELTVTSIDEGDPADLKKLPGTPYYIRLEATVVSGDAYDFFAERFVSGFVDGERLNSVASPTTVGPCARTYFELDPPVGTTIESCVTTIVDPGGAPVDEIVYSFDGDGFTEDDLYASWS